MFERFFPDEYVVSTYVIPFERLYEEGYRGVIFASFESLFRQPVQFALAAFFVKCLKLEFHSSSTKSFEKAVILV